MKYIERKDKKVYLAGAMEYAAQKGKPWRKIVSRTLRDKGYQVYSPTEDEDVILDIYEYKNVEEFHASKKSPNTLEYNKFVDCMNAVVIQDLREVRKADAIFLYIDQTLCSKPSGTTGEITVAFLDDTPIIGLCAPGIEKRDIPGWILGCVDIITVNKREAYRWIDEEILTKASVAKRDKVRFREEPARATSLRSATRNRKNTNLRSKKVRSR